MIVACGEALIDFVPARADNGERAYVPRPGGSPFNVALTAGRLGVPVGFASAVSTDFFGDRIVAALAASHVDLRYVMRIDRPTTLAFVDIEAHEPAYAFFDREASPRFWAPHVPLADDVAIVQASFGALLPIDEPAATDYLDLFVANRGQRIRAFDPNVRPSVIGDREMRYRARLEEFFAAADIVKISSADLAWYAPSRTPEEAASRWLAAGVSLVVVTSGAAGAVAYTAARRVQVAARPVRVVDTVGAGDSFMGALLAGLLRLDVRDPAVLPDLDEATLERLLAYAGAVAAFTCTRSGADPPDTMEVPFPPPLGGEEQIHADDVRAPGR